MPIGNLLSQLLALIYLNELDHFIKRKLKVKKYIRYVDDFILLDLQKDEAFLYLEQIKAFLKNELGLSLSKFVCEKSKKGVNFAGFRTWQNRVLLRKYHLKDFKTSLKKADVLRMISRFALAFRTNTLKHYKALIFLFQRQDLMPKKIQARLEN